MATVYKVEGKTEIKALILPDTVALVDALKVLKLDREQVKITIAEIA